MRKRHNQKGFTLIEILIALGIVAILSILAWRGLEDVLRSAKRVNQVDDQLQTTTAVLTQLQSDLTQARVTDFNANFAPDSVTVDTAGLTLEVTQRPDGKPAFQQQIQWSWAQGQLLRVSRTLAQEDDQKPLIEQSTIPMEGFAVRLWMEPGGWTAPVQFGKVSALGDYSFDLAGYPNTLELATTGITGQDKSSSNAVVRGLEITLTQPNGQSVRKILLTGALQ